LYKLNFNSDGLGVLVGKQNSSPSKADSSSMVLATSDKGQTWTDISANLNAKTKSNGRVENSLVNVIFSKDKGIVVLSSDGKIFNTTDRGKSWNSIAVLADEPPQTAVSHFGELENKKFWLAGGTMSIEGKWSVIAITNNSGWDKHRLDNYYFYDVEFLSNDELIACGFAYNIDNSSGKTKESYKGVVVYSSNGGKNWETVHDNQSAGKFYSIYKISKNKMFVTGENRVQLILDKISKPAGN